MGVPPVLQAASLKRKVGEPHPQIRRGVPPVLQAASLKPLGLKFGLFRLFERSACIAGGLIEAQVAGPGRSLSARVPPVLQAASLKHLGAGGDAAQLRAFRLYCRRPH